MKVFSPGQIASSKDVNDNFAELKRDISTVQTDRPHIVTVPVNKSIGNTNYTNQVITIPTFRTPPTVLFSNASDNTLILARTLAVTTTSVSLQFQTADRSHLGTLRGTLILIGAK